MQKLIGKFCVDNKNNNGLLLIDMPTGMGKTYAVTKFIAENYNKIKGKIFFITQLKKNLPEDDLLKRFKELGKEEDFERLVLRVENNVDNLCKNFGAVKKELEKYIKDKQLIWKIDREVQVINRKNAIAEEDWLLVQQARDDLSEVSEKKLRDLVTAYLKYDDKGKERSTQERKQLIAHDDKYSWIGTLYPTVFMDEKKIFLMSLDKFLLRYSTIIEPSINLFESEYITKGAVFIDEFDTTKDVILNRIIQNGLYNKVSIVNVFRVIYSGLFDTDFTTSLTDQSAEYSAAKYTPITEIIDTFRIMAKDIMENHNLNFLHKLKDEYRDDVSFLFQDYKLHTIINGQNKRIEVDSDDTQNVNWLKVRELNESKDTEENDSIYNLIGDIIKFLDYFQTGVGFIADNYIALRKERRQADFKITLESAIKTALAEFGIYGTMQQFLTYNIMLSRKGKRHNRKINDALDSTVYEKGFKYYHIIDNDNHDTQSRINYVAFNDTPEKFLIRLIERTKVVGISASANLPTVLANYDLDYIRKERHELMFEPSADDEERLRAEFAKSIAQYERTHIYCGSIGYEDKLSDEAKRLYRQYSAILDLEDYLQERYLCFSEAVETFFKNKQIQSLLYFSNTKGREFYKDKDNYLIQYFNELKKLYGVDAEIVFLCGNNEIFERRRENVLTMLKNGGKVFVFTTYGSMGAGQNIHYKFDSGKESDLVKVNSLSYNNDEKDFDAIYLDSPTHVMVNPTRGFDSDEDFIKYIYQVKFLQEVGNLTVLQAEKRVRDAFKLNNGVGCKPAAHPKDAPHFNMAFAKIAMQAIGRICRTGNKRNNIHILYQRDFAERIKPVVSYFDGKSINPEFKAFLQSCQQIGNVQALLQSEQILNAKAVSVIAQSQKLFDNVIGNWTINNVDYWEKVREAVLRDPTTDDLGNVQFPELYIELPQKSNKYYVNKSIRPIGIAFHECGYGWECVDEKYVMLDKVLMIPGVKEYFEESGYATSFQAGKYILAENVLKRIYQGALGEVVGRCILTKKLFRYIDKKFELLDIAKYEKFDSKSDDVYFDFKLWSGKYDPSYKSKIKNIRNKMYSCKARKVVFVNIFNNGMELRPVIETLEDPILILPYLYDLKEKTWNGDGIRRLYEIMERLDN
ncbi:MAG: hypothetical protein K2M47_02940 [Clostridiales bacterium]|nr:hypothetical protein [Clostridiales bacterium]